MLLNRNLLECVTIVSCSGTLICVLLNYVTNISPITGIWFPIYVSAVFVISVSLSFKFLQWLLHLNKPIKYDLERLVQEYPYLTFLNKILPHTRKKVQEECKEYDTNELSVITTVLERKLVSSWYVPYISQEIGFPFACKQMLDQMIGKTFQICNKIEPKDVYVDMCSILISHLKEYRKAVKRHEKCPTSSIESLYKTCHPTSNPDSQVQLADHCTNVLRVILKELVPWELWDTPHSELLVRILAKKLDVFINTTLADPAWLNEKILWLIKGDEVLTTRPDGQDEETNKQEEVNVENQDILVKEEIVVDPMTDKTDKPTVESALSTLITKTTAPILQRAINEEFQDEQASILSSEELPSVAEEAPVLTSDPVDIKTSPVLRQRRGRQGRNEVKIHDRIIEGSVKTWETDLDLQCISLGQDLLASLDGEITLSRLWEQDADAEGSPNPPRSKSPQPLWFGEEDAIEIEGESAPQISPARKDHSPKPADALLKDLQSTVSQAKTRIGDLQVPTVPLHVPRNQCSGDEAAGMMEGLLDFGIAGLKKGLRFTGLSDDSQEKSPSHRAVERSSPPEVGKAKPASEPKDIITSSVIQKEENGSSTVPHLIKQQRVSSQDSVLSQGKPIPREGAPLPPLADSPEPEYEEAADLSTSIAKLRCLLQQRAETTHRDRGVREASGAQESREPQPREDIWWEGAEETRGRTQLHHSSRPIDTATLADEYNMNIDRNTSPGQTSNNMQRLDRLFQRTVTGVFNSIKTAVGAEGADGGDADAPRVPHDWTYVTTSIELSVCGSVARLLGARRALAQVDAALDPLHQLPAPPVRPPPQPEDFEEWCSMHGPGWCGLSEVAAAAGLYSAHVTHRIATLLFAEVAEAVLDAQLCIAARRVRSAVFALFAADARAGGAAHKHTPPPVDLDATVDVIMSALPPVVVCLFGVEAVSGGVRLALSSTSCPRAWRDVCARALDALATRFKQAADLRNPSFDAN